MDKQNLNLSSIDDVLTENETLNLLGIKKSALERLRWQSKLPFCKISRVSRVYLLRDVLDFIVSTRIRMNVHD